MNAGEEVAMPPQAQPPDVVLAVAGAPPAGIIGQWQTVGGTPRWSESFSCESPGDAFPESVASTRAMTLESTPKDCRRETTEDTCASVRPAADATAGASDSTMPAETRYAANLNQEVRYICIGNGYKARP